MKKDIDFYSTVRFYLWTKPVPNKHKKDDNSKFAIKSVGSYVVGAFMSFHEPKGLHFYVP